MRPPVEANSRHLRLARRALRAAVTHLRNARGLTSMPEVTQERVRLAAIELESVVVPWTERVEREANIHLSSQLNRRTTRRDTP